MRSFLVFVALASSLPARAGDEAAEVRAVFDRHVELSNAFDPAAIEIFMPDARLSTRRDGVEGPPLTGALFRDNAPKLMAMAKERNDRTRYENVRVTPHGGGFRVQALRISELKCYEDASFYMDFQRVEGEWRVVEHFSETVSLSRCPATRSQRKALKALERKVRPLLPLDLDEETRLESVAAQGRNLVYTQRLHRYAGDELDLEVLAPELQRLALTAACTQAEMRALVDDGVTVRYATIDRDGATLATVDVTPGLCGLAGL